MAYLRRANRSSPIDWDEVESDGNFALFEASQSWNPDRSSTKSFAGYARIHVWHRMVRACRIQDRPRTGYNLDRIPIRDRVPWLVPLFPVGFYSPLSGCGHRGPIAEGSVFVCMVCYRSGWDDHPAMQRSAETDPAPERKPKPAPTKKSRPETRRERRARLFG